MRELDWKSDDGGIGASLSSGLLGGALAAYMGVLARDGTCGRDIVVQRRVGGKVA